jgi:hypothetical protein
MRPSDARTSRRRWRLFLAVEGALLLVAFASTWAAFVVRPGGWVVWPLSVLWTWLVYTLPIAALYLLGRPPVMTLAPLIPSAQSRAFRRELKGRQALSADEFYARFYEGSGVPRDVAVGVRRSLGGFEWLADRRLAPSDYLPWLDDDLDLADVLYRLGREFGVRFTGADYPAVDGTLDNLVRLVHARLGQAGHL